MPNILLSKIKTPINLLVGVIFCILLINKVTFYGKGIIVIIFFLINVISAKLKIKIIFKSWYRFRYLLLSTVSFNLYFSYPDYESVLDKLLLIMAMLTLVNTYMQYESKNNIAKALAGLLYPFKFLGFKPKPTALLFIATLDKVEKLKLDVNVKKVKFSDAIKPAKSLELIANRLAIHIQNIDNPESEKA